MNFLALLLCLSLSSFAVVHGAERTVSSSSSVNNNDDNGTITTTSNSDMPIWQAARIECARIEIKWDNDFDLCVYEVVRTGDVGMATLWNQAADALSEPDQWLQSARIACAAVQGLENGRLIVQDVVTSDFDLCVQDILLNENLELAERWVLKANARSNLRGTKVGP